MRDAMVADGNLSLVSQNLRPADGGQIMDQVNLGWLAGILEGEGCFHLQKQTGRQDPHPKIRVQMCDEEIVKRLQEITGVGRVRKASPPSNENWSQPWDWTVTIKKDVARILLAVYPLMSTRKQEQIAGLAEFVSYKGIK